MKRIQRKNKLLITTTDVTFQGGVQSSCSNFLDWAEQKGCFDIQIAHGSLRKHDSTNVTIRSLLNGQIRPQIETSIYRQYHTHRVGGYFPKIECLRYLPNRNLWAELIRKFDFHQVISGYAVDALPFAYNQVPFALWAATDLDSERVAAIQDRPFGIRTLNAIQMPVLRQLESYVLSRAQWVFTHTEWMRQRLIERGASEDRSSVLPIPVDTSVWKADKSASNAAFNIISSGRLSDPRKNIGLLIDAFEIALSHFPQARLILVGPLSDNSLREKVKKQGLDSHVSFLGDLELLDRVKAHQASRVFVLPSLQEGLCIAALEAMACELPVVSTFCGGPQTYLSQGENGFLVKDAASMAEAICSILNNSSLQNKLGRQGRRLICDRFSASEFGRKIEAAYSAIWNLSLGEEPSARIISKK